MVFILNIDLCSELHGQRKELEKRPEGKGNSQQWDFLSVCAIVSLQVVSVLGKLKAKFDHGHLWICSI